MLELKNISSGYGKKTVLNNISLNFPTGQITSIIGPNAGGKSTLLKTAVGIITPSSGNVFIDGTSLDSIPRKTAAKKISYLAQARQIPDMTVEQTVLHGRFPYLSYPHRYSIEDKELASAAMEQMNLTDAKHLPLSSLSGGMLQNTFIAMALAQNTDYILLDEPTTHLDVANQINLMERLNLLAKKGKGIVTVMHDLVFAMEYSDLITVVHNGKIATTDTPENIFHSNIITEIFGVTLNRYKNTYFYERT